MGSRSGFRALLIILIGPARRRDERCVSAACRRKSAIDHHGRGLSISRSAVRSSRRAACRSAPDAAPHRDQGNGGRLELMYSSDDSAGAIGIVIASGRSTAWPTPGRCRRLGI